jgi:hypothetical protein
VDTDLCPLSILTYDKYSPFYLNYAIHMSLGCGP